MTYIATEEGWAFLAVLLDLFSRRVVGWAISVTNDTELALAALERAVRGRHGGNVSRAAAASGLARRDFQTLRARQKR